MNIAVACLPSGATDYLASIPGLLLEKHGVGIGWFLIIKSLTLPLTSSNAVEGIG